DRLACKNAVLSRRRNCEQTGQQKVFCAQHMDAEVFQIEAALATSTSGRWSIVVRPLALNVLSTPACRKRFRK
ncbi:MAG TPA: hypothetical protein VM680_08720, partial [Verrucomicrobiae bacterium]|nr:hypothetical protein [Verrucomicrobiae bacterium]